MNYYIGQIFKEMYPSEAADWCNENNLQIVELEQEEGVRRFQIQEIPEPPAPTKEEQKEKRAFAYQVEVDTITSHIQRLRDLEPTEEILLEIAELIKEREAKVEEIKDRYPYPVE